MRFLSVIAIWAVIFGIIFIYMDKRDELSGAVAPLVVPQDEKAENDYRLELQATFAIVPDPFAVVEESGEASAAITVSMGGNVFFRSADMISKGETLKTDPIDGLIIGENEVFVKAATPLSEAASHAALRVRLLENGIPGDEKVFWSTSGAPISGAFRFTIHKKSEDDHAR